MKLNPIILCLLFTSNAMAQSASVGDRGHGGDPIAQEFTLASTVSIEYAKFSVGQDLTPNDYRLLGESLKNTKVFATSNKLCKENDCKSGVEFTALNRPIDQIIELNIEKWSKLSWDEKMSIALHEHMGIVGLERSNYFLSTKLLDNRKIRTPEKLPVFMVDRLTLTVRKEIFIPVKTNIFTITWASGGERTTVKYESESHYYSCEFHVVPSDKPRIMRLGRKIELHERLGGLSTSGNSEFQFFEATGNDKSIKYIKCKTNAEDPFNVLKNSYFEVDAWQGQIDNG